MLRDRGPMILRSPVFQGKESVRQVVFKILEAQRKQREQREIVLKKCHALRSLEGVMRKSCRFCPACEAKVLFYCESISRVRGAGETARVLTVYFCCCGLVLFVCFFFLSFWCFCILKSNNPTRKIMYSSMASVAT